MLQTLKAIALFGCIFCFAGCGGSSPELPPRAAVSGTVLLDDQPLKEGVIRFVPTEDTKGPKISATIENGSFSLSGDLGPWVGKHKVEIESTDDGGFAPDDETAVDRMIQQRVKKIEIVEVPPIYNTRTQLDAVIEPDQDNKLEFKLTSQSQRRR